MGTQIELRHMAFFNAMGAVTKQEARKVKASEDETKKNEAAGASNYAVSSPSPAKGPEGKERTSLFSDCAQLKGSRPLTVPYSFNGQKESVGVCLEGMPKLNLSGTAGKLDRDIKDAISRVVPATVQLKVVGNNRQQWSGSGFIMDPADVRRMLPGIKIEPGEYYIHTNHHVAADAKAIMAITADGKHRLSAEVVKAPSGALLMDEIGDTALVRIKSEVALPTAKTGPRSIVEQGDTVLTAGFPLALPRVSVTKGIVSQPAQMTGETLLAIQADAAINGGNSGGPLFTLDGTVIGTNTYTFRGANDLSFANAITEQFDLLGTIWQKGEIVRGDLGIDFMPLGFFERNAPGLPPRMNGALVGDVASGSKAEKAGLKAGDIVTEVRVMEKGQVKKRIAIDFENDFQYTQVLQAIHSLKPGQKVELGIFRREGDSKSFSYRRGSVKLEAVSYVPRTSVSEQSWGISAVRSKSGEIFVSGTGEKNPGALSELGRGDWILSGIRARELADFKTQAVSSISDLQTMFRVMRQKGTTQMILYVRNRKDPRQIRTVVLERDLGNLAAKRNGEVRAA
ncbi:MAG TPA: trypsin-like peptidase domain-containing protein [bacterium]|nr:trypsin-like peptidase domain-containing protein [bacterium]